jgi:hypothetical protein
MVVGPRYVASPRTPQKTPLPTVLLLLHHIAIGMDHGHTTAPHSYSTVAFVSVGVTTWMLWRHCLAMAVVCRTTPWQWLSMLVSQFLLSANMPQYSVCWLLTAETRDQAQVSSCGICEQSETGVVSSKYLNSPSQISFCQMFHFSYHMVLVHQSYMMKVFHNTVNYTHCSCEKWSKLVQKRMESAA